MFSKCTVYDPYLLHMGSAEQNAVPVTSWMNGAIVEERSIGIFGVLMPSRRYNLQWVSGSRISVPDSVTDLLSNLWANRFLFLSASVPPNVCLLFRLKKMVRSRSCYANYHRINMLLSRTYQPWKGIFKNYYRGWLLTIIKAVTASVSEQLQSKQTRKRECSGSRGIKQSVSRFIASQWQ